MNAEPTTAPWHLQPGELPPFRTVNLEGTAPFVLVCDHASNRVPLALADLGLPAHLLGLHIAWDIGIEALTRSLVPMLNAPAVFSSYSRLVIDMNRGLKFEDSIPEVSDEHEIPGNLNLSEAERAQRAKVLFHPYHSAIAATLHTARKRVFAPGLISMHSFTPHMDGNTRPWHVSIMWKNDGRIAEPLIDALRARGLSVGDNEPYTSFDPRGHTMEAHAERHHYPHVLIEVRQDLLTDEEGIETWSVLLRETLGEILADPGLYAADE